MSHPTRRQALIKAARVQGDFTRVEIARVTCQTCGQKNILALPDGVTPRPHLRLAVQGDLGWSAIVPVRVACEEDGE